MTTVETDAALRCPSCRTAWPNTPEFLRCPDCQVTTSRQNARPVSNKYAFERYARRWDHVETVRRTDEENARFADLETALANTPSIPDPDESDHA